METKTKSEFLALYEMEIRARYAWASDETKLHKFLESAKATLYGENTWSHIGGAVNAAWQKLGKSGSPSLKKLRSLCG